MPRPRISANAADADDDNSDPNRPLLDLPADAATVIRDEMICFFRVNCNTNSPPRKTISHIFGRNKKCTRSVPDNVWIHFCRKHYQRSRYRTQDYGRLQCELVIVQIKRLQVWSDDCAQKGLNCRLIDWQLTVRKREAKRIDAAKKKKAAGKDAALKKRKRIDDDVDGDEEEEANNSDDDDAPPVEGCPAPDWLLQEAGNGLSTAKVLETAERLLTYLRSPQSDGKFPDIELLPNIINEQAQAPRPRKSIKKNANQSGRGRTASHSRSLSESVASQHSDNYSVAGGRNLASYSQPPTYNRGGPGLGSRLDLTTRPIGNVSETHTAAPRAYDHNQGYGYNNQAPPMGFSPQGPVGMMSSRQYFDHATGMRPKGHMRAQSEITAHHHQQGHVAQNGFNGEGYGGYGQQGGYGHQGGYQRPEQYGQSFYHPQSQPQQHGYFQQHGSYAHHDDRVQHSTTHGFVPSATQTAAPTMNTPPHLYNRPMANAHDHHTTHRPPVSRHARNASTPVISGGMHPQSQYRTPISGPPENHIQHGHPNGSHNFQFAGPPMAPQYPGMQHEARHDQTPSSQAKDHEGSPNIDRKESSPHNQNNYRRS